MPLFSPSSIPWGMLVMVAGVAAGACAAAAQPGARPLPAPPRLSPRNLEAPFPYRPGASRRWPIFAAGAGRQGIVRFKARREGTLLGEGEALAIEGVRVALSSDGRIEVDSRPGGPQPAFDLEVEHRPPGEEPERQTLQVRPAPPERPLSYYADFVDEIIRIFLDTSTGRYRPIRKDGFDQYFRRLQAQGITRLIVWLSPFPLIADPDAYRRKDWQNARAQAQAILDSPELTEVLSKRTGFTTWGWIRALMAIRTDPEFGRMLSRSAEEHGIRMSVSFRPFEPAVSKYYEMPVFDADGRFLRWYFPFASPAVGEHAEEVGWAHYRKVLEEMGRAEEAESGALRILAPGNADVFLKRFRERGDNLRITAARFPPLQSDSFVLQQQGAGRFRLVRYASLKEQAEAAGYAVRGFDVRREPDGSLLVTGLRVPSEYRYLLVTGGRPEDALEVKAEEPARLLSRAGTTLGRVNTYWALDETTPERKRTLAAGIPADGEYHSQFYATEASGDYHTGKEAAVRLSGRTLVIDRGDSWTPEMVDYSRPAARAYVVRELKAILALPAFDEIFLNARSHTQLAASLADDASAGGGGIRPVARYRAERKPYYHLGLDRAYAPRSVGRDAALRRAVKERGVEQITEWQPGEWAEPCGSPETPFAWRYARNRAVADGMRRLIRDLEREFPRTRLRVVLPEREAVIRAVEAGLETMPKPGGGTYGREYYRQLWNSNNHIPAVGEGLSMVDLSGLRAEPVFLGIRYLPDQGPLRLFLREQFRDMADNHGSRFRGPRSYFYEGHEALTRAGDGTPNTPEREAARRGWEERVTFLLAHPDEIREVILYEAADWAYYLPPANPDLSGHGFLDRREAVLKRGGWQPLGRDEVTPGSG